MKTTIVPAQITSVEDKIAGNISVKQVLLLTTPVFLGTGIFAFVPPFIGYAHFKLAIVATLTFVCSVLAIRWRGKLIAEWISILGRYNSRPRYYVFSKKDVYLRPTSAQKNVQSNVEIEEVQKVKLAPPKLALAPADSVQIQHLLENPDSDLHFSVSKKGGLRVHIKEINQAN